jgi:hypothetical protein
VYGTGNYKVRSFTAEDAEGTAGEEVKDLMFVLKP